MEETKICPFCGKEVLAIAKKCKYCNNWFNIECPYCAEEINPMETECPHCHSKLDSKLKNINNNKNENKINKKEESQKPMSNKPLNATIEIEQKNDKCYTYVIFEVISIIIAIIIYFKFGYSFAISFVVIYFIYFLPSSIADARLHPNITAILLVNLFFGVTIFGWIIAFIWAFTNTDKKVLNCTINENRKDNNE